jgi:serine/threonine-protein kinase
VLDFGISRSISDSSGGDMRLTSTSTLIGSPLYMSPEQMRSPREVDARTDIWSLGAILYEMLVARPPFEAETLPQLCELVLTETPPRLSGLRPEIPPALEAAVHRCLERERDDRWPSVTALAEALTPFQARAAAPMHGFSEPEMRSTLVIGPTGKSDDRWQVIEGGTGSRRKLAVGVGVLALVGAAGAVTASSLGSTDFFSGESHSTHRIESAATDPGAAKTSTGAAAQPELDPEEEVSDEGSDSVDEEVPSKPAAAATRVEPVVDSEQAKPEQARRERRAPRKARPANAQPEQDETNDELPDFGGRR